VRLVGLPERRWVCGSYPEICKRVFLTAYHSPFPGVKAVPCFLEELCGLSSGGRFLVWGAPLYAGGLLEAYICGV
jgi:hypothetical protein